ncbi:MAG: MBL fold metallo-hydrolase [Candidatus Komeilibacteria bacterium]|nr:MBL fold metallo-hydrolase [Candidatus Komeilibacteria bacterium]
MDYQGLQISHFAQSGFRLKTGGQVIYLDPYNLKEDQVELANYVFISHGHFDHCSKNDLAKIITKETVVVASRECQKQLAGLRVKEIIYIGPGETVDLKELQAVAVQAYNLDKFRDDGQLYHTLSGDEVGFVLEINQVRLYHAGDTDKIPEMAELKDIDLALLPVSGTYTMTYKEAAEAAAIIKPKIAIPMHYGSVVGSIADAEKFKAAAEKLGIKTEII